jgi:eukaryotic-like serine/threonine-protein kinase
MSLCINPRCSDPQNPDDRLFCKSCGSEVLLEGRYRVLAQLAHGGCGTIYNVSDLDGSAKVLKVLSINEPKAVELFRREAQVLCQLDHPGIPKVEPNAYFTYLSKKATEPLHCLVMDPLLAVQWLIQLTAILQSVHEQNFLHRDIKPSNIMLKADGHLVLIDFGTVRSITDIYANRQEAAEATRIMSALYTSDEQIKGKPVPQSDFFALGRTFVYLLTATALNELYDAETDKLQWRGAVPNLSSSLANLLDRLMAPSVSQRPANAATVLQELTQIQQEFYSSSGITPLRLEEAATQLPSHSMQNQSVLPSPTSPLSAEFIALCQQELAEFIGPIAAIICQRTLARNPQRSQQGFIDAIAAQIANPQDARDFRQRFEER